MVLADLFLIQGEIMQKVKYYNSKLHLFLDKLEAHFGELAEKFL